MIEELITQLKKIYNGNAWHGSNIVRGITDLPLSQLTKRIGDGNNIAELVHHIYAWRYYVIQQLNGNSTFDVKDDFNFIRFETIKEEQWTYLKNQLADSQKELIVSLKNYDSSALQETIVGKEHYRMMDLLHGIIHHDLYHLGQIMILRQV